ncbi:MAG: hypothetical protein REI09_02925 [Candidatus Dactylopiibacterium sp.]|nr:hypothetical protein [Candidatus Dactylopiibacterium sp.]
MTRRLDLKALAAGEAGAQALGISAYGEPAGEDVCVPLATLTAASPRRFAWCVKGGGALREGRVGALRYRHDDDLLFGWISLAEAGHAAPEGVSALEAISHDAYAAVFAALAQTGFTHLLRCWNYLPRINLDGGGLERYRQFNIGRQDAFIAAQRTWLEGAPSACALGSAQGELVVYFLAGRVPADPIENPRQLSAYRYPAQYGPRAPTFSRASLLPLDGVDVLFISGTASIVGHESLHPGDVRAQTRETLENLAALVTEASRRARFGAFALEDLKLKVFVREPADLAAVQDELHTRLGAVADVCYLQADVCRAELLVEIEAFGFLDAEPAC